MLVTIMSVAFATEPAAATTTPVIQLTRDEIAACAVRSHTANGYAECLRATAAADAEIARARMSGVNQAVVATATAESIRAGNTVTVNQTGSGQAVTSAKPSQVDVTLDEHGLSVTATNITPSPALPGGFSDSRGHPVTRAYDLYTMPTGGGYPTRGLSTATVLEKMRGDIADIRAGEQGQWLMLDAHDREIYGDPNLTSSGR